ncbi:hypothetical protein HHK36_004950 [Tetracentron sinense]|uniref:Uncharacterized protein n=1 Tax=Tetracentron sinense TaxID=13715 RepID=A0A834ZKR4_TETSI|nr:hypothetical protein HHK36_004950 [Tetracentron sinense]
MGIINMKAWFLCVVLMICLVLLNHVEGARLEKFLVIDPCKRPGGPHPGCIPEGGQSNSPPVPANPYRRGCSKFNRCRGGPAGTGDRELEDEIQTPSLAPYYKPGTSSSSLEFLRSATLPEILLTDGLLLCSSLFSCRAPCFLDIQFLQSKDEATRSEAVGMEFPLGEELEVQGGGQPLLPIGPSPVLPEASAETASADPADEQKIKWIKGELCIVDRVCIDTLAEEHDKGNKDDNGWKSQAYHTILKAMKEKLSKALHKDNIRSQLMEKTLPY